MSRGVRITLRVIVILIVVFAVIQLVPYGRDHSNPPVTNEYQWKSPEAKAVAVKACYDCHSNETVWPWYTNVAPSSWLVQYDVNVGRDKVNFSEWPQGGTTAAQESTGEIADVVDGGEMPPIQYTLIHGEARLSDAERRLLVDEFKTGR